MVVHDKTDSCSYNSAINCDCARCSNRCGWHPQERERRHEMIGTGALRPNFAGKLRLKISRGEAAC